ncbi:amidohydrolase family protein [Nordella sp. HKS 07]|uniref:amidohydrolase family protein n=1 Tax=Nordella sp. HKS 07 TaxID=2712222 RepID=UPI0013E1375E|nr:amidohydrolase family protein [Nordella sp. HKS 07]QIG47406.1 amidohydrolase family protein [Nordella sp. HKS 07]
MIVDSHVHVWSADPFAYPWQPLLAHVPPPQSPAPVETLIADMDRAGVAMAVLVQPSVYGRDHRYLAACLKAHPERFVGVCLVDPASSVPDADLRQLLAENSYRGLRLNTIRQGDCAGLLAPDRRRLFDAAEELRLSVSFHMDIDQAPVVAELAERYVSTPFIIDYLGPDIHARADAARHLDLLAAHRNVYFKLLCVAEDAETPYPFADIMPFYEAVLARFGAERVMFGSDYPGAARLCAYEKLIAWGQNFPGPTVAGRRLVMGETARRLFGA